MEKKNRAAAWLLAALVCFGAVMGAGAVEPLEVHMETVTASGGVLTIYCNANAEEAARDGVFNVTLGNAALDVLSVTAFAGADAGISIVFLADVSGSIKEAQFQAVKDTISLICAGLSEKDNVSIFAIGDGTYTQPFVSSPEDIQAQIDGIERSREDTNLYESIKKSLSILKTHEQCHDKKALVIFSDGEEDIFDGITLDEVNAFIDESHIPVYTVATLGPNPPSRYVETAKTLGSFARRSAGGRHYIHNNDLSVSEEIAGDVTASIQNGLIVRAGLDGFSSGGEDLVLRLELVLPDMGKAGDGYAISTVGLSEPEGGWPSPGEPDGEGEEAPPPWQPPEPAQTPEAGTDEPAEKSFAFGAFIKDNLLWVVIGGSVLFLLIITLILILVLRRRRADAVPPPAQFIPPPPAPVKAAPKPPPGSPKIALRLTKVGLSEEQVFRSEFAGQIVLGRDPDKASLPFQGDDMLSSRHCSISYEPEGIILRDLGSTNGTFVNGLPILKQHKLENDDILLIGSMELRVNWKIL